MAAPLKLISHKLCPYVQRAVIALTEKGVAFERIDIDLANKPDWFLKLSPLGKAPVLHGRRRGHLRERRSSGISRGDRKADAAASADPLRRAEHRAWIEFGSAVLSDIGGSKPPMMPRFRRPSGAARSEVCAAEARVGRPVV